MGRSGSPRRRPTRVRNKEDCGWKDFACCHHFQAPNRTRVLSKRPLPKGQGSVVQTAFGLPPFFSPLTGQPKSRALQTKEPARISLLQYTNARGKAFARQYCRWRYQQIGGYLCRRVESVKPCLANIGAAVPRRGKRRCVGAGRCCLPAARALREGTPGFGRESEIFPACKRACFGRAENGVQSILPLPCNASQAAAVRTSDSSEPQQSTPAPCSWGRRAPRPCGSAGGRHCRPCLRCKLRFPATQARRLLRVSRLAAVRTSDSSEPQQSTPAPRAGLSLIHI